jgi:hypothetical protein
MRTAVEQQQRFSTDSNKLQQGTPQQNITATLKFDNIKMFLSPNCIQLLGVLS